MRLIDADDLKKWLERWKGYLDDDMIRRMQICSKDIPTIEERKKGKWMTKSTFMPDHYGGYYIDQYVCTNCESEFFKPSKFCPNCGSDQRGDGNDN